MFVGVMTAAHLLIIPGAVFTLTAGAIFGVLLGASLAWIGAVIGQTLAFCTGRWVWPGLACYQCCHHLPVWCAFMLERQCTCRYLLREWVASYMIKKFPQVHDASGVVFYSLLDM